MGQKSAAWNLAVRFLGQHIHVIVESPGLSDGIPADDLRRRHEPRPCRGVARAVSAVQLRLHPTAAERDRC